MSQADPEPWLPSPKESTAKHHHSQHQHHLHGRPTRHTRRTERQSQLHLVEHMETPHFLYSKPSHPAPPASVILSLSDVHGHLQFPCCYPLELHGHLSPEEFTNVVAELNATARQYGPRMTPWSVLLFLMPCTGVCTVLAMQSQFDDMTAEIQVTCQAINAARGGAGGKRRIHLVYREVPLGGGGGCGRGFREMCYQVELQVL